MAEKTKKAQIFKRDNTWWSKNWFYTILIAVAVIGGVCAFLVVPFVVPQPFSKDDSISTLRQAVLVATGGFLAILTLWENRRKNDQEHMRQVHAERRARYAKAIEQLADEKLPIRLGGVYTLVKLVDEWLADEKALPNEEERREEGQVIINSLCAYIRSPFDLASKIWLLSKDKVPENYAGGTEQRTKDQAKFREEKGLRLTILNAIKTRLNSGTIIQEKGTEKILKGPWSDFDYDFSGAVFFYPTNFSSSLFGASSNFAQATFIRGAIFSGATFTRVNFSKAIFTGATFTSAKFDRATFTEDADFREAVFTERVYFVKATFIKHAIFYDTTFSGDTSFSGVTFINRARFSDATFKREVRFINTIFTKDADFYGSTWGKANFSAATFTEDADFCEATFIKDAHFSKAKFTAGAGFSKAFFEEEPIFEYTLDGKTNKAKFSHKANPEDYNFEVSPDSPYKIETEEQEHNGTKFTIPKGAELFDPDEPSEQGNNDGS